MKSPPSLLHKKSIFLKLHLLWAALLLCAACLLITSDATSQSAVEQLHDTIAKGDLTIEAIVGTGSSTGLAIKGYLANQSSVVQNINIHLDVPVYFANRGKGQNMVATQVYGRGGSFFSDGTHGFVSIPGNSRTPVEFVAFCVDFDKTNPTSNDLFDVTDMPAEIHGVVRSITEVEQANLNSDLTVAAQLALWVTQGESLEDIRERFEFSQIDVVWMHQILRQLDAQH